MFGELHKRKSPVLSTVCMLHQACVCLTKRKTLNRSTKPLMDSLACFTTLSFNR